MGLVKGDDLLSPQGEISFNWPTWPPEILSQAGDLLLQMEKHVASCLSGQTRTVPPPGMAAMAPGYEAATHTAADVPELSSEEDIAGSFNLPDNEQPKQF